MALTVPNNNTPLVCQDGTATRAMQLFMGQVAPAIVNFRVTGLPVAKLGDLATVSDGDAGLAWGATITNTGTSSTKYMVWYNGSGWRVIGK
ncbi:MAG: hypothetical protein ACXVCX_16375 [Ktedonobacterales bacterium]